MGADGAPPELERIPKQHRTNWRAQPHKKTILFEHKYQAALLWFLLTAQRGGQLLFQGKIATIVQPNLVGRGQYCMQLSDTPDHRLALNKQTDHSHQSLNVALVCTLEADLYQSDQEAPAMNAASRLARRQGESLVKNLREYSELAVAGVGAPGRYVDTMPSILPWAQSLSYIQPSKVRAVPRI